MTDEKVRSIASGAFEIDELAGLVPMASEDEQEALTADIREHGQREAIVLYKGKVVDGRCRQTSIITLGNRDIKYRELDSNLTREEVAVFVKSVNTRRNLTVTQKAFSAAISKMNKTDKRQIPVVAKSWGISKDLLSNAKYIMEQDEAIGKALFDGKAVNIIDSKGRETTSSKVTTVYAYLKRMEEKVPKDPKEYGWDAKSYIKTQAGKEWFFETIKQIKNGELKDVNKLLADLANYKFKKEIGE